MSNDWYPDIAGRQGPRYAAIADEIGDALASGRLSGGMQLPTQRDLARRLNVTIGTVSRAYQEAERRGFVSGEVGRGTYIRETARQSATAAAARVPTVAKSGSAASVQRRPISQPTDRTISSQSASSPAENAVAKGNATDRPDVHINGDDLVGTPRTPERRISDPAAKPTDRPNVAPPIVEAADVAAREERPASGSDDKRDSAAAKQLRETGLDEVRPTEEKPSTDSARPAVKSTGLYGNSVVHLFRRSEKKGPPPLTPASRRAVPTAPIRPAKPTPPHPGPSSADAQALAAIAARPLNLASSRLPDADESELRDCLTEILRDMDPVALAATSVAPTDTRSCRAASRVLARIGVSTGAGEVVIAPSGGAALDAVLSVTTRAGDGVLVEALMDPTIRTIALRHDLRLNTVQLDREGVVPESFELACWSSQARHFLIAPSAQNPTATTLTNGRRQAILEIAERYGVTVIEWTGSLPQKENAPDALAALAPHRTIHVADLANCALTGLRLGVVTGPDDILERIGRELVNQHRSLPGLLTGLLEAIAAPGAYEALIETQSRLLLDRRRVLRRALGDPEADALTVADSHGWLRLPETWRASDFAVAAAVRGVLVASAEHFQAGRGPVPRAVRLAWGGLSGIEEAANAGAILGQILQQPNDDRLVTG